MITFYASESATKYANIPDDILRSGTVSDFLAHFKNNGYISSAQYVAKQLELKVVVNEADLVRTAVEFLCQLTVNCFTSVSRLGR